MSLVRAALDELLGLFVGDWFQALGILAILAAGYAAVRLTHVLGIGFVVALTLAAHLVFTTVRASRGRH